MSTYKEIVGQKITKVTSDPSDPRTGQMWYNETTGSLRGLGVVQAWSSGGPLITTKYEIAGFGSQTAAVMAAGRTTAASTDVQEYNGTGYSSGTAYPENMRNGAGCGTETAGLVFGGRRDSAPSGSNAPLTLTAEYDGSSWTAGGSMGAGRYGLAAAGTQTAAVGFAGYIAANPPFTPPSGDSNRTEEYNGTSWTTGNTMGTARYRLAGNGTQTAALGAGGYVYPSTTNNTETEEYDGTNWSSGGALPEGKKGPRSWGAQTDAVLTGGSKPPSNTAITATVNYDGSSWSSNPASLATGRMQMGASTGTSADTAVISGGQPSGATTQTAITEEYNKSTNIITSGGFTSGGSLPSPLGPANKYTVIAAFGNTPALTTAGGAPGAAANAASLNYDGTSYSANPDTNNGAAGRGGAGTQTAGVAFGGVSTFSRVAKTEEWDGSSWTTSGDLNNSRDLMSSAGTQTAALAAGGYTGLVGSLATEEYNGSTWTSGNNINYGSPGVINGSGGGTQTAGWIAGGFSSPASPVTTYSNHSRYDGTNWTSSTALPTALCDHSSGGTQTAGIVMGGRDDATSGPTYFSSAFTFDGSAWSTTGSLATARREGNRGFCNSAPSSLIAGGYTGSDSRATEEFTEGSTIANVETFGTE